MKSDAIKVRWIQSPADRRKKLSTLKWILSHDAPRWMLCADHCATRNLLCQVTKLLYGLEGVSFMCLIQKISSKIMTTSIQD